MKDKSRKIGLVTATALVVGNMIGSGIFVLPATLASYGGVSILGWVFTAAGALVLAKIFSNFSKVIVNKSGGPYIYSKEGFGEFLGFLVAWGYWISCWVVNAAIAVAIVSALSVFFPILEHNSLLAVIVGLSFIWLFTWLNSEGVRTSGKFQLFTTILKVIPLLFVIVVGCFFFSIDNFPEFNRSASNDFDAFSAVATLTLFAFLGLESATIPAANVKDPSRTVSRATMLGTSISAMIYVCGTVVLFGLLPIEQLSSSPAPFAEAAKIFGGEMAGYFVAGGAAIAAIGALNGWILMMGQISMASSKDTLFPKIFKRENVKGVPIAGIIIGSILSSILLLMNFTEGLVKQFEFMVLLTTLCTLVPYLFTAASYALVVVAKKVGGGIWQPISLACLGFGYSIWAIYGAGKEAVFYGLLLLLIGVPFYVIMKLRR